MSINSQSYPYKLEQENTKLHELLFLSYEKHNQMNSLLADYKERAVTAERLLEIQERKLRQIRGLVL